MSSSIQTQYPQQYLYILVSSVSQYSFFISSVSSASQFSIFISSSLNTLHPLHPFTHSIHFSPFVSTQSNQILITLRKLTIMCLYYLCLSMLCKLLPFSLLKVKCYQNVNKRVQVAYIHSTDMITTILFPT